MAGQFSMIAGDTFVQEFEILAASSYSVTIKPKNADGTVDVDAEAVIFVTNDDGLVTVNGDDADTSTRATLAYSSGTLTLTVHSDITKLITAGSYEITAKSFSSSLDTSAVNRGDLTVTDSGIDAVTTGSTPDPDALTMDFSDADNSGYIALLGAI